MIDSQFFFYFSFRLAGRMSSETDGISDSDDSVLSQDDGVEESVSDSDEESNGEEESVADLGIMKNKYNLPHFQLGVLGGVG